MTPPARKNWRSNGRSAPTRASCPAPRAEPQQPPEQSADLVQEAIDNDKRIIGGIRGYEELLATDFLPDPSTLTIGELARLVWEIERLHASAGSSRDAWDWKYTLDISIRILRCQKIMLNSTGSLELRQYLNAEIGREFTPESVREVEQRLAKALGKTFEEIRRLTLVSAVAVVTTPKQANPAPQPSPDQPAVPAPVEVTEGKQADPSPPPPTPQPIDVVDKLRRDGSPTQAALVEYMSPTVRPVRRDQAPRPR